MIMKETDLRIGNWYNSVKHNRPVQCTAEDIYELVVRADGASIEGYISEMFEPLQLTPKLMESFGLKKSKFPCTTHEITISHLDCCLIIEDDFSYALYDNEKNLDLGAYVTPPPKIEFAHQLQDIYRALKGEELTAKEL